MLHDDAAFPTPGAARARLGPPGAPPARQRGAAARDRLHPLLVCAPRAEAGSRAAPSGPAACQAQKSCRRDMSHSLQRRSWSAKLSYFVFPGLRVTLIPEPSSLNFRAEAQFSRDPALWRGRKSSSVLSFIGFMDEIQPLGPSS